LSSEIFDIIDSKGIFPQQTNIKPHKRHIALLGCTALLKFKCTAAGNFFASSLFPGLSLKDIPADGQAINSRFNPIRGRPAVLPDAAGSF
jgi:hypothetical protein